MNPSKPTERSIIADITALLPGLSEDGTRRVQAEVNIALAGRRLPKITRPAAEMLCDYPERRISASPPAIRKAPCYVSLSRIPSACPADRDWATPPVPLFPTPARLSRIAWLYVRILNLKLLALPPSSAHTWTSGERFCTLTPVPSSDCFCTLTQFVHPFGRY